MARTTDITIKVDATEAVAALERLQDAIRAAIELAEDAIARWEAAATPDRRHVGPGVAPDPGGSTTPPPGTETPTTRG